MDNENIKIGDINFPELIEEQFAGNKKITKIGLCSIYVYDNEGNLPHCHIFNKDKSFETCVRLDIAEYFSHGGKYNDIFNSKQSKELNNWFKEKNKADENFTNWEICRLFWNISMTQFNNKNKITINKQPDYSKL